MSHRIVLLESQLKRYTNLVNEFETNKQLYEELLKKAFMGVLLNDPDDIKLEKIYQAKDKSLQNDISTMKRECRENQLAYRDLFKNSSVPSNHLKYLWALSNEEIKMK